MLSESIGSFQKATELSGGSPLMLGWLGHAMAQGGNPVEARAVLERLRGLAREMYVPPSSFAWIHLGLGEIDNAFEGIEQAIDARDPMIIPIKSYPFLDPIRSDRRYLALLHKMNLEAD